ncbi:AMP-binding protein, partial [Paraburkholderia aspalathi]|uniref:AMP-binding protein n=1 Tax=Paraburkholderia aspalathi TaxID=1324617 RepID=UPI0038BBDE4B
MIEHRNVVQQISALQTLYGLNPTDRLLQFAALSFDMSVEEIGGALLSGATLVLRTDAWLGDPQSWSSLCERHGISVANLPTQFWQQLAQARDVSIPSSLRQIMIGGEAVSHAALQDWWSRQGYLPVLYNAYGPTETTINASILRCQPDSPASS